MRTEIFTEAWRLYRTYELTFGQALSIAWTNYKIDSLSDKMNLLEAKGNTKEANEIMPLLRPLFTKKNSISMKLRIAYVSNGAQHDYMTGRYMAD